MITLLLYLNIKASEASRNSLKYKYKNTPDNAENVILKVAYFEKSKGGILTPNTPLDKRLQCYL